MYDLAIIGGGPAAVAAGVYASRKQLKTVFITKDFGGQSIVSDSIENWIGDVVVSGQDLAKKLETHLKTYAENIVDVEEGHYAQEVKKIDENDISKGFVITTDKDSFEAHAVLIATGSNRRKLPASIENADAFEHKGITYCASCDGPMFSGKDVVVIGGGNAGFESAAQLLAYTNSVTLLNRSDEFKADPITIEAVLKDPKMTAIKNADTQRILADNFVTGLVYKDTVSNEEKEISCQGIFVEIGSVPSTSLVKNTVELDNTNHVVVDPWTQRTTQEGIWSAGDCTNGKYHQNNIAAGDAVKALEDIYVWLKKNK